MVTRWHYCISVEMGSLDSEWAKNFGLQEENINISKPQGQTKREGGREREGEARLLS